jgi:hypothetical protein
MATQPMIIAAANDPYKLTETNAREIVDHQIDVIESRLRSG